MGRIRLIAIWVPLLLLKNVVGDNIVAVGTASSAAETTDAEPSPQPATIYFRNGDYLPGEFVECENGSQIRWKTDLFEAPGTFDFGGIDNVIFGQVQRPQATSQANALPTARNRLLGAMGRITTALSTANKVVAEAKPTAADDFELGSRVQTSRGYVLFGHVLSLDEEWLSLRGSRHGQYRIRRNEVERIDGLSGNLQLLVDAVGGFQKMSSLGTGRKLSDWDVRSGRLATTKSGANFFAPIEHDGPVVLQLVVMAEKRPYFLVALGARKDIKHIKSAPSVETWGTQLVAHRQSGTDFKHIVLAESLGNENRLDLDVYVDRAKGRMMVYSGSKLLGEFVDEPQQSARQTGLYLRNNGADLIVEQCHLKTWNGRTTPVQPAAKHLVLLPNGEALTGQVLAINSKSELTIQVSNEESPRTIALRDIDQVVFSNSQSTAADTSNTDETFTNNIKVRYLDGGFVVGKYLRTQSDGLVISVDGVEKPLRLGWTNMGRVQFLHEDDLRAQDQPGVIERAGYKIHGRVVQADADGKVMWQPFASGQPIPLNLATTAKVSFDSVSATRFDSQLTDQLHLTNGDTIPCRLLAIDQSDVLVRFADGTDGAVAREVLKGIRRRPPESFIYSGFENEEVWHVSTDDPKAFSLENGVLELTRSAYLSRDVGLPERACISFDAQWTGDCTMYFGYGADESSEAVRRRQNTGYSAKMMENEAKRPRDFYGEVSLTRTGRSLSANGYLRSSGLLGQMFANQNAYGQNSSSVLAVDDDTIVNVDIFIDRSRRLFSVVANGQTLRSWKETARIDGTAIYFGFASSSEQARVNFGWGAQVKKSTSPGHIRISNLRVARWPGVVPDEKKERLLTQRLGARPKTMTHVLRAFNGDSLRGTLIAVQNDTVVFKSRLDTITIPLEKVSEIIALREVAKPDGAAFSLELHGGGSVVMNPIQVTEALLVGESPLVGRLAVPWLLVSQLNVGHSFKRSVSNLVSWTLRAPPALPDELAANVESAAPSPLIGKRAPDLDLTMLDGSQTKLSQLEGKTVILDFWATWCGPCIAALPQVMEVAADHNDDVVLIAVNQREDEDTIETFLATHGWDELSVALDEDGNAGRQFGVSAIPHTVIIDPNGVIQDIHVGAKLNLKDALVEAILSQDP